MIPGVEVFHECVWYDGYTIDEISVDDPQIEEFDDGHDDDGIGQPDEWNNGPCSVCDNKQNDQCTDNEGGVYSVQSFFFSGGGDVYAFVHVTFAEKNVVVHVEKTISEKGDIVIVF